MSNEEKAALAGRLLLERNQALEDKVALEVELRDLVSVLGHMETQLKYMTVEHAESRFRPMAKFLNVDALVAFIRRRAEVDQAIDARTAQLRQLGVEQR